MTPKLFENWLRDFFKKNFFSGFVIFEMHFCAFHIYVEYQSVCPHHVKTSSEKTSVDLQVRSLGPSALPTFGFQKSENWLQKRLQCPQTLAVTASSPVRRPEYWLGGSLWLPQIGSETFFQNLSCGQNGHWPLDLAPLKKESLNLPKIQQFLQELKIRIRLCGHIWSTGQLSTYGVCLDLQYSPKMYNRKGVLDWDPPQNKNYFKRESLEKKKVVTMKDQIRLHFISPWLLMA